MISRRTLYRVKEVMRMKRWFLALMAVCMLLVCSSALAEDVCFISDVTRETGVTTGCSYLRLRVPVEEEAQVLLTITGKNGRTVYQRDFGLCSGPFRTEDIYLKLQGASTVYDVALQVGEKLYTFPVERVTGHLTGTAGCTMGVLLREITGQSGWRMATVLLNRDGETTVPVVAGGAYTVGRATFLVAQGKLTVTVELDEAVDGSVDNAKVFVATDMTAASRLGKNKFTGLTGKLNKSIDLGSAPWAAVYVNLSLSFDPNGASAAPEAIDEAQQELWLQLQDDGAAVG